MVQYTYVNRCNKSYKWTYRQKLHGHLDGCTCTFMIETIERVGLEGRYPDKIKMIYDKAMGNIILNREKTQNNAIKI